MTKDRRFTTRSVPHWGDPRLWRNPHESGRHYNDSRVWFAPLCARRDAQLRWLHASLEHDLCPLWLIELVMEGWEYVPEIAGDA